MIRALLLAALAVVAVERITEYDVAWYLRAGEEILRRHGLPASDPFSFTSRQGWLNHEWLCEVILALAHRTGGFVAVGLLQGLLVAGVVGALIWAGAAPMAGMSPLAYAIAGAIFREMASPRAQLFSNLLFAATYALAVRDWREDSPSGRRLLAVLPIGLFWTQIHGGNPTGVIVLGLLFLSGPSWRRALVAAGAAILTCVGPYGLRVHSHYLENHASMPNIREWQPLSTALAAGSGVHWAFLALAGAAAGALIVRARAGERVRFEALALGLFTVTAIRYVRFSAEDSVIAAVALAPALARVRVSRAVGAAAAAAALAIGVLVSHRALGFGLDADHFPVAAVEYLRRTRPPGPMFNGYNFGGYLMWAYPEERVFIDGRAFTVYPEQMIKDLVDVYGHPSHFAELDARWHFRLAVLQRRGRGAGLVAWFRQQPDWQVAYQDEVAVIAVRRPEPPAP